MSVTAVYCRISRDATDEGLGVERQREDCLALADRLNLRVVEVFTDNDTSASTSSRKPRPEYDAMIALVRSGEVGTVLAYSTSRLTRRPLELEAWISLHAETGAVVRTVASGDDDLSTADGRMMARLKASIDAAEAERTSERLVRKWQADAAAGKPRPGRYRVFGYSRAFEVVEDEALIVEEVFSRRVKGESVTGIARDLAGRGLLTAAGKSWTSSSLAKLLSRPGYAGLREYRNQIVGKTNYPALVDEITFKAAQVAGEQSPAGTNSRRWLLSGLARCGRCTGAMTGSAPINAYRCRVADGRGCGKTRVRVDWLEGPVVTLVMAREEARGPRPETITSPTTSGPTLSQIDEEIDAVRAAYSIGDLALADMTPILRDLRSKRAGIEALAVKSLAFTSLRFAERYVWSTLDLSARRVLIARHLDSVEVGPRTSTGPGRFEPGRYLIRWRDGTTQRVTTADLERQPAWQPQTESWIYPETGAQEPVTSMEVFDGLLD